MKILKIPSQMEYNTAISTVYIAFTAYTAHTAYTVLTAWEQIRQLCLYTYNMVKWFYGLLRKKWDLSGWSRKLKII